MMFNRPRGDRNTSKSRAKSNLKMDSSRVSKSPLNFKPKTKLLLQYPQVIDLSENLVFAGGHSEMVIDLTPLQEMFIETGKRVVNAKLEVKDETIKDTFWLSDPTSVNLYQLFDTVMISQPTQIKVVGRSPEVQVTTQITGVLQLTFEGIERAVNIPLRMACQVPKIVCLTNLENLNKGYGVIRMPIKNKGVCSQIPFRNDSPYDLTFQIRLIGASKSGTSRYQVLTPQILAVKKNQRFCLQIDIKENRNSPAEVPPISTIRKLIQLKVCGSKQFFTFPLQLLVYETSEL